MKFGIFYELQRRARGRGDELRLYQNALRNSRPPTGSAMTMPGSWTSFPGSSPAGILSPAASQAPRRSARPRHFPAHHHHPAAVASGSPCSICLKTRCEFGMGESASITD